MQRFLLLSLSAIAVWCMPHYSVENWVNSTTVDSVEYQLLLPLSVLHGKDGRKQDLQTFQNFLKAQLGKDNVKRTMAQNIRQVTLFDISLMDPSQNQHEEETEWELKYRTFIDGKASEIGTSDLTIKRGAVPVGFDWYPDHAAILEVSASSVENKNELDIQCAERDFTQATKFEFPRGTVPFLYSYDDLKFYFPKLFQTRELAEQLAKTPKYLKSRLPIGEISFEWDAEVVANVEGVEVTFVFGTRHSSLENAREGEEGWAIRPPELNFRVKRSALSSVKSSQTKFLSEMERIFNALLQSEWNGHQDCGQWNGARSCAPGYKLTGGECVVEGCGSVAEPVSKIPRGAGVMPAAPAAHTSLPAAPAVAVATTATAPRPPPASSSSSSTNLARPSLPPSYASSSSFPSSSSSFPSSSSSFPSATSAGAFFASTTTSATSSAVKPVQPATLPFFPLRAQPPSMAPAHSPSSNGLPMNNSPWG